MAFLDEVVGDANYHQVVTDKEESVQNVTFTSSNRTKIKDYYKYLVNIPGEVRHFNFSVTAEKTEKQGKKETEGFSFD